jgi:hypothetical protein
VDGVAVNDAESVSHSHSGDSESGFGAALKAECAYIMRPKFSRKNGV